MRFILSDGQRRFWFLASIFLAITSFLIFKWQDNNYHQAQKDLQEQANARALSEAQRESAIIDKTLRRVMSQTEQVAHDLNTGLINRETLEKQLYNTQYMNPDIQEIGVAFAPYEWDPAIRLHGVAYTLQGRNIVPRKLDIMHDYTDKGVSWYELPIVSQVPTWIARTRLESTDTDVAIYSVPFKLPNATQTSGVIYVAYALDRLNALLATLKLGETDYGYVLSAQNELLAHPNHDYFKNPKEFVAPSVPKITTEIPAIGGSLVVISEIQMENPIETRNALIGTGLALGLAIFFLTVVASQFIKNSSHRSWLISILFSLAMLCATTFVLKLVDQFPDYKGLDVTQIPTKLALKELVEAQNRKALNQGKTLPATLPTGIMVQSITFLSEKDLRVAGYVWQRYTKGVHDNLVRGFNIPESNGFEATEIYHEKQGDIEVISWNFHTVIHVEYDSKFFPFDSENLSIPLASKDFYGNVLLVPNIDAYPLVMPTSIPGLRQNLVIPRWNIKSSVFGYAPRTYKARFGIDSKIESIDLPELNLTISSKKNITGFFVTYLLPIGVVLMLLFLTLFLFHRDQNGNFDGLRVITACGSFFLVVIFSQVDLRKALGTRSIVYLEYFHFTAYIAILAVVVCATIFMRTNKNMLLGDLVIYYVKRFFWPVIFSVIFTFTINTFI